MEDNFFKKKGNGKKGKNIVHNLQRMNHKPQSGARRCNPVYNNITINKESNVHTESVVLWLHVLKPVCITLAPSGGSINNALLLFLLWQVKMSALNMANYHWQQKQAQLCLCNIASLNIYSLDSGETALFFLQHNLHIIWTHPVYNHKTITLDSLFLHWSEHISLQPAYR